MALIFKVPNTVGLEAKMLTVFRSIGTNEVPQLKIFLEND